MKIVFFSANQNVFDGSLTTVHLPPCAAGWARLKKAEPNHEFAVVAQLPSDFLLDIQEKEATALPVETKIIKQGASAEEIADAVRSLSPDIAVSASAWGAPFDWLSLFDSEVAKILGEYGIKTICISEDTAFSCFDKWQTHLRLSALEIPVARAVFVDHALFFCAGNRREICRNVYRDATLSRIKSLKFPLVIKDTTGLSSYGMEVVQDFEGARRFLEGKRNSSNRIVEEFLTGEQFGLEIHGSAEIGWRILPPFRFSVNNYGITSPKQSVKIGPVLDEKKYKLNELNEMMKKLAKELGFSGIVQVDLVFSQKKWHVIEINPRLSGMSQTYAASLGISLQEMIFFSAIKPNQNALLPSLNIKLPLLSPEKLTAIKAKPYVFHVSQTENRAARQEREKGFCEVILCAKSFLELSKKLDDLASSFPESVEMAFVETARTLFRDFL